MEKTAEDDTEMTRQLDDVNCSSDFKNTRSYSSIQQDVADLFTSVQEFTDLPDFTTHISGEDFMEKMEDIREQLHSRKNDLLKTDCAIVIAGETSAGKSSVINLIIGEDILPTDTLATTSSICRMKYAEKLQISTCDSEGRQTKVTEFDDNESMAKNLSELATTRNEYIKYIDVWLPLEILKGNIVIVDTPGIGDKKQEEVAEMMMDYIPNALAFVFVVNMASAGGLQEDRIGRILERVGGCLNQMHSFDPKDTIFLLNKWDALVTKNRKTDLFEDIKKKLHSIWETIDDKYVLKFAAAKIEDSEEYQRQFNHFQEILKTIITKNENKRIIVHTEFIRTFIEGCDVVVASKKKVARQNKEENKKILDKLSRDLQDTESNRQEAFEHLQQNVDEFLDNTSRALYEYIHSQEFKRRILLDIDKHSRILIGGVMESRIQKETYSWQETNIKEMFKREIMERIAQSFINIHESLHRITDKMKGFTSPFDVERKLAIALVSFFASSAPAIAGSILMTRMSVGRDAAIAVAATGLFSSALFSGLVAFDVLDDVDTTIKNAYRARMKTYTIDKIKQSLSKAYAEVLKNIIQNFLEGDLRKEIRNLERNVESMREKVDLIQKEESSLISLYSEISKIRNRLKELENTDVQMDEF